MEIFYNKEQEKKFKKGLKIIKRYAETLEDADMDAIIVADEDLRFAYSLNIVLDTEEFDKLSEKDNKELAKLGFKLVETSSRDRINFFIGKE